VSSGTLNLAQPTNESSTSTQQAPVHTHTRRHLQQQHVSITPANLNQ